LVNYFIIEVEVSLIKSFHSESGSWVDKKDRTVSGIRVNNKFKRDFIISSVAGRICKTWLTQLL